MTQLSRYLATFTAAARRQRSPLLVLALLALAVLLAACNLQGVTGFSPTNNVVAIVQDNMFYTTDLSGGNLQAYEQPRPGFDITFGPFGNRLLYVNQDAEVCLAEVGSTSESCPVSLGNPTAGILSFLPSGDFIVAYQEGETRRMAIYRPDGTQIEQRSFDQYFLPPDLYKLKETLSPGDEFGGEEWMFEPYANNMVRWAISDGAEVFLYEAGSTIQGPTKLAGELTTAQRDVLVNRSLSDVSSGALSPDGQRLLFRTEQDDGYNLFLLDLSQEPSQLTPLVTNAPFRIEYAFSPDGSQIAYESTQGGRSIWLVDVDGTGARQLSGAGSLPQWHAAP
ncbi:MAG: hypothetical protein R3272_04150 [Candidatus Promineifilaceae bacterium]|nr:hypothetical protein [Candidatus Promineifilaceae bacterium]